MFGRMSTPPVLDRPGGRLPRLLVITPDFPPARGGIQVLAHRLVTGMTGFERRVLTFDGPGAREFDDAGRLSVRRVRADPRLRAARNVILNAAALEEAMRFRPDMVLCAHIVLAPAVVLIRRALGCRSAQYLYAKEIGNRPRLAAFAVRHADVAIGLSAYTVDLIVRSGVPRASVTVIPPGVDLPSDPSPLPCAHPTFVTVARLQDRYKGHDVLMRSMPLIRERVPDVRWVIVGDGPLRGELQELASALGVSDAVTFTGPASDRERDGWIRRATLLAMPSRLPEGGLAGEGYGIVYLEAGTFGKPVVAANVAGALDAVVDGETGLLVDPTDPAAVAGAITTLLLDSDLAARLGRAGAARAATLSWPQIARRVQDLLLGRLAPGATS
jgi:phosphatidylinositol alpha-1,6-mannosyltransferase